MFSSRQKILTVVMAALLLSGCSLPFVPQKKAGISVTATPNAGVFINDNHIGSTPYYNEKMKPGEYVLKIVPESGIGLPWESKVTLLPGIMTVISRQLGQTEEQSSGYYLTLEPGGKKDAATIEVVTEPDKAVITVDGESKGFSPISLDNLTAGEHVVLITAPGYIERSINANLRSGHTLKASIDLSRSDLPADSSSNADTEEEEVSEDEVLDVLPDVSPSPTTRSRPTATPKASLPANAQTKPLTDLKPPYITVLDTPTGFLNVREEPSTSGNNIIAKIKPKESYVYIERNQSGWVKIEISPGEEGWVSSKYVKIIQR
jgi:uncharacterized protein YgiM (DUF1202 family)